MAKKEKTEKNVAMLNVFLWSFWFVQDPRQRGPSNVHVLVCVDVVNSHVEHQLLDLSVQPRVIKNGSPKITQKIVH